MWYLCIVWALATGIFAAIAVDNKSPWFAGLAVAFLGGVIIFSARAAAYDVVDNVEQMLKKSQTKSDKS
ncbi:MAG: hypothetical protein NTY61_00505 [Candidatus Parcubacteria bacterium]|nr:hypothetical protein [Candidatus Parcubacteria bacterium]